MQPANKAIAPELRGNRPKLSDKAAQSLVSMWTKHVTSEIGFSNYDELAAALAEQHALWKAVN